MTETNLIIKIEALEKNKNDSVRTLIAKYLLNNVELIDKLTINNVAKDCFCSKSSIVKFCKELGLEGFKELIRILIWEYSIYKVFKTEKPIMSDSQHYFSNIFDNLRMIERNQINDFQLVAQQIHNSKRVFLFGKGPNTHICEIFKNYLIKLNYSTFSSTDLDVQEKFVKNINADDICFIFTYSGLTAVMIKIWEQINAKNAKIVILTANSNTLEFRNSDYKFLIKNNEEIFENQRSGIITFNVIMMQILNCLNKIK